MFPHCHDDHVREDMARGSHNRFLMLPVLVKNFNTLEVWQGLQGCAEVYVVY